MCSSAWLELGADFAQGLHDEGADEHARMGDDEVGLVDVDLVVEQDVDVDGPVVIDAVGAGLLAAAQLALDALGAAQQLAGRELGADANDGIHEGMVGLKAPRLGFVIS